EFARTLATLLQGGIPIVSALETTRLSVSSSLRSKAIAQVQEEVTGGRSIASALRLTGFFPAIALDMVEVGEATGALPGMLESVAEFFEEDVNIDLATLVAFVEIDIYVLDRKSTRLNSSHVAISYSVFCLKKKKN